MKLTNFKGLRELEIEFNDSITSILGKNGSGKTTIFDAFTWLLFGKDSEDRKVFNIKTLDASGKAIEKIPHEVTALLLVNGEEITLCRRIKEKWVRKRGSASEEFTGHEEERLYNDVPMSVRDWTEKIGAICTEETFKFITNPNYFPSQKADVQRAMLMRMAGAISDEEIAFGNDDFQRLLADLTGKTLEEYKREVAADKRRIKAETETIPARIEECRRMMPKEENWEELEKQVKDRQQLVAQLERQIADRSIAYNEANKAWGEKSRQQSDLMSERSVLELKIKEQVMAEYNTRKAKQQELQGKAAIEKARLHQLQLQLVEADKRLSRLKADKEAVISQWREVNSRQLQFGENEFVCPTCGRPLEIDDIERKQQELTANFNTRKAADLAEINRKGQALKQQITECEERLAAINGKITRQDEELDRIEAEERQNTDTLTVPDATAEITANAEWQRLTSEIENLGGELEQRAAAPDTSELFNQKQQLAGEIDELNARLLKRDFITMNQERISELENQLRVQMNELSELEGIEFTMAAFSKAKIEAVESRINHLFGIVKFKMFETQINGGEVETCEATVDGVPYSDLNNAMKINAGLDIINAICKSEGITAPLFIDNAEAVNKLLPTESQMIRLVVTEDNELTINN